MDSLGGRLKKLAMEPPFRLFVRAFLKRLPVSTSTLALWDLRTPRARSGRRSLTPNPKRNLSSALIFLLALTSVASADGDIPIGVFKGRQYYGWGVDGAAFRPGPVGGDMLPQLEIENAPDGAAVASSEVDGDGPTGTLTSPEFTIRTKVHRLHGRRRPLRAAHLRRSARRRQGRPQRHRLAERPADAGLLGRRGPGRPDRQDPARGPRQRPLGAHQRRPHLADRCARSPPARRSRSMGSCCGRNSISPPDSGP